MSQEKQTSTVPEGNNANFLFYCQLQTVIQYPQCICKLLRFALPGLSLEDDDSILQFGFILLPIFSGVMKKLSYNSTYYYRFQMIGCRRHLLQHLETSSSKLSSPYSLFQSNLSVKLHGYLCASLGLNCALHVPNPQLHNDVKREKKHQQRTSPSVTNSVCFSLLLHLYTSNRESDTN